MTLRRSGVVLGVVVLLSLTTFAAERALPVRADSLAVQIVEPSLLPTSWGYDAASQAARTGDTIAWTNTGTAPHTVTADDGSFDSGLIASGDTWSFTATTPGTYTYSCSFHPDMHGTLVITD